MKDHEQKELLRKSLITGAAGFIGFHLSKRLLEHSCNA